MRKISLLFFIFVFFLSSIFLISCQKNHNDNNSDKDNNVTDLSVNSDKTVLATITKDGFDYTLTISGSGDVIDYSSVDAVPWNYLATRIKKIIIEDSVTSLGDYYFTMFNDKEFILSSKITKISKHAFKDDVKLYAYNNNLIYNGNCKIYYYSETQPSELNKYFHLVDGKVVIWAMNRILFIGNSFTYRPGTEDDAMIPKLYKQIAESLGENVIVDYVVKGSHTLSEYADKTTELGKKIVDYLNTNTYTYVILQEQSTRPINYYNLFHDGVVDLNALVKSTQNDCQVCLYETWGSPTAIEGKYSSIREMEEILRSKYEQVGNELHLPVYYIGKAFTYINENNPDIYLYADDNRHQNLNGAFLSACMHVMYTLKLDVRNSSFNSTIDSKTAETLKKVAYGIYSNTLSLDNPSGGETNNGDFVIAWYKKEATSGLNTTIIDQVETSLKAYLTAQGIEKSVIDKITFRGYEGNVETSCTAIKNDNDVSLMIGWKSNVDTNGKLSYIKAYPGTTDSTGITMGTVNDRWIHMLKEDSLSTLIYDYFISDDGQTIFVLK